MKRGPLVRTVGEREAGRVGREEGGVDIGWDGEGDLRSNSIIDPPLRLNEELGLCVSTWRG